MEWYRSIVDKSKWHVWFAWHPVVIEVSPDNQTIKLIWFEKVLRCRTYIIEMGWKYKYRKLKENKWN